MKVVLYTTEFEPITVLELPMKLIDLLEEHGGVRVPVSQASVTTATPLEDIPPDTIDLFCTKILWHDGSPKTVLVARDERTALSLTPTWLPGQTKSIQAYNSLVKNLIEKLQGQ